MAAVGAGVKSFGSETRPRMVEGGGFQGTPAEYITADADLLVRKPKEPGMREVAVLPLNTITVWEGLVDPADVSSAL